MPSAFRGGRRGCRTDQAGLPKCQESQPAMEGPEPASGPVACRRCPRGASCSSCQSRRQSDMSDAGWVVIEPTLPSPAWKQRRGGPRNTATSPPAASRTVCRDHGLSVGQGRRDCRQSLPLSGRRCTGPCLVQYWCMSGPVPEGASRMPGWEAPDQHIESRHRNPEIAVGISVPVSSGNSSAALP